MANHRLPGRSAHLALLVLGIASIAAAQSKDEKEAYRKSVLARLAKEGLSNENRYLKGRLIGVGAFPPKRRADPTGPYPKDGFPYRWDFDDGSLCGINSTNDVEDVRVEDGVLRFKTVGDDPYFGWGNFDPKQPGLRIGYGHLCSLVIGRMDYIKIRLRQSLPLSILQAAVKRHDGKSVHTSEPVTLMGSKWQTVTIPMGPLAAPFTGVRIHPKTPENELEIDWVRPCTHGVPHQYRKTFELPAKVRWAKVSASTHERYTIYMNGRAVVRSEPRTYRFQMFDHELEPSLFRVGKNVISFENTVWYEGSFVLDGALLCEDGTYVRFDSDATWKSSFGQEGRAWTRADFDDGNWPNARLTHEITSTLPQPEDEVEFWYFNPSYKGRIMVVPADGRGQPVFGSKEEIALEVRMPRKAGEEREASYQVFDEMGDGFHARDELLKEAELPLEPDGRDDIGRIVFPAGELKHNAAYAVTIRLRIDGTEVERRRYEIAICGPVEQPVVKNPHRYTDGMELKLVWEVDAAAEQKLGEYVSADGEGQECESPVIATPLGRFRHVAPAGYKGRAAYVSFRYTIQNPGRPHLAIGEYPADTRRVQELRITEPMPETGAGAWNVMELGNNTVNIGLEHPLTHRLEQHTVVFFPNHRVGAISAFSIAEQANRRPEHAARIGKIRIYEILNDIPRRQIVDAPGPRKWVGQQSEAGPRQIMQSCFTSPIANTYRNLFPATETPNFYRNWLVTFVNLIKRLRFAGDNAYFCGQYMYAGKLFPTEAAYGSEFSWGANGTLKDYGVLLSKLFEENDMGWFTSLEMTDLTPIVLQGSDDDVARGRPTLGQVDRYGKQHHGFGSATFRFKTVLPNWVHPDVRPNFEQVISDIIRLYGKQPGWKGINLYVDALNGPIWTGGPFLGHDPYGGSYDDYTIARFEKETGTRMPVKANDPDRFDKRYKWLLGNVRKQWTDWRCEKLSDLYDWVRDRLVSTRPGLRLIIAPGIQCTPSVEERTEARLPVYEYARQWGFDVERYKDDPRVILTTVSSTAAGGLRRWQQDIVPTARRLAARTDEFLTPFANDGVNGLVVRYGWHEPDVHGPKGWVWGYSETEAYDRPSGEYLLDHYVNGFVRTNPTLINMPNTDYVLWIGREHTISRFNHAFRSIPIAKYTRLRGRGRDRNVWIQTARYGSDVYGYVANTQWWEADATLQLVEGAALFDLIEQQPIKGRTWSLRLRPYDIRTFRVRGAPDADVVASCSMAVSEHAGKVIGAWLASLEARFRQHESKLKPSGADQPIRQFLGEVRGALDGGDLSEAYDLLAMSDIPVRLGYASWHDPDYRPKTIEAKRMVKTIVLDGDLSEWAEVPSARLHERKQVRTLKGPAWQGSDDYSGTTQVQWDEQNLYLAFAVTDRMHYVAEEGWLWTGDCVELFFDTEIAADYGDPEYSLDDVKMTIALPTDPRDTVRFYFRRGWQIDMPTEGMKGAFKKLEKGYVIEALIPWRFIATSPTRGGLKMGFDLKLIDVTRKGHLRQMMIWSSHTNYPQRDPRTLGRLVLVE